MVFRDVVASICKFYRDKYNASDHGRLALIENRQDEFYENDCSSSDEEHDADAVVAIQPVIKNGGLDVPDLHDGGSVDEDIDFKHEEGYGARRKSERIVRKLQVNMNEETWLFARDIYFSDKF